MAWPGPPIASIISGMVRLGFVVKLRRRLADERGQSLVLIAGAMFAVMALATFGVDVAGWYAKHRDVQKTADAAALAAANCLANGQAGSTCTSTSDTTDAQTEAISYAQKNGYTITASNISFDTTSKTVTVTVPTTGTVYFGHAVGISGPAISASSKATWNGSYVPPCSSSAQAAGSCGFMFALSTACTTDNTSPISITYNGTTTISGTIRSNGSLYIQKQDNAGTTAGRAEWSNSPSTCAYTHPGTDPFAASEGTIAPLSAYPIDYSKDFPACSGAACTGPGGTPSFCTIASTAASWSIGTPANGNIYCAVGTGSTVKAYDPSTWNGAMSISGSGSPSYATYVGGSFTSSSNNTSLASCGYAASGYTASLCSATVPSPPATPNYPIFYLTGTGTALSLSGNGGGSYSGDMFVPNGTASFNLGGGKTLTTYIEASKISYTGNGNITGDGPAQTSSGGYNVSGGDALTQ